MAHGSTINLATRNRMAPRLKDAGGAERHLLARCTAPACRRAATCGLKPWLAEGLDDTLLIAFSERLRCVCGGRRAELEISLGPYVAEGHPDLFIFR
jgi:hypothetical protein